jgi:cytochrome P450
MGAAKSKRCSTERARAPAVLARFSRSFLGDRAKDAPRNLLRRIFDPRAMRPYVATWEQVAAALLQRVHREAVGGVPDERTRSLLAELLTYPGVPREGREIDTTLSALPVVPVVYAKGDARFAYFSTVTTLGTPADITLQEIRIECFFPATPETEGAARELAGAAP